MPNTGPIEPLFIVVIILIVVGILLAVLMALRRR
ncbi:MAG: LPXTG cell wall anchor domain-containing protein [Actinomycetes bacterium]